MQKLRLFISADLPKESFVDLERIQQEIKKLLPEAKLVEKDSIHVTLKFLGQVPKEKIEEITSKLESLDFPEIELSMEKIGTFKSGSKASVVWIKALGLEEVQKKIDLLLADLFPKEKRFVPHFTLARIKSTPLEIKNLKNIQIPTKKFKIKMIKLKKSTLTSSNPIHTTLSLVQSKDGSHSNNRSFNTGSSNRGNHGLNSRNTQ